MPANHIPPDITERFEVHEWKHATAILKSDFPIQWRDILDLLRQFRICKSWIAVGGGRKSKVAESVDTFLFRRGWVEKEFATSVSVDTSTFESPTHNEDGEWVTFGDAKSAPKGPHAIVEYLFGVGEVVNVETDPEQATIVADIVAY